MDAFHQEYIPITCVRNVLVASARYGIPTCVRVTTTKRHSLAEALADLPIEVLLHAVIVASSCVPRGRGATISEDEIYYDEVPFGACKEVLNLTIRQNGDVYPCCSGGDTCPSLRLGNARKEGLAEILWRLQYNFKIRVLVELGPRYIAHLLIRDGCGRKLTERQFVNMCHLCTEIWSDPTLSRAAERIIEMKAQMFQKHVVQRDAVG